MQPVPPPVRHDARRRDHVAAEPAHIDVLGQVAAVADRLATIGGEQIEVHAVARRQHRQRFRQLRADLRLGLALQPLQRPHFAGLGIGARVEIEHEQRQASRMLDRFSAFGRMAGAQADQRIRKALPPGGDLLGVGARLLEAAGASDRLPAGILVGAKQRLLVVGIARKNRPAPRGIAECGREQLRGRRRSATARPGGRFLIPIVHDLGADRLETRDAAIAEALRKIPGQCHGRR
jgi:hypothetical protein